MPSFSRNTTGKEVVEAFADSVTGKTFLITGPSVKSIGAETAISLAHESPAQIILAGRNESKITPVIEQIKTLNPKIKVTFLQIDLADQGSIRKAAAEINASVEKLNYLINCAGVMAVPTLETTKDGIEMQFGLNHIGHFLFTNLIIRKIIAAGNGARIINITSTGFEHGGVRYEDWNFHEGDDYHMWGAYAQSKTANVLFSAALAEKLKSKGIQSYSVHPGVILESNLSTHVTQEMWTSAFEWANRGNKGEEQAQVAMEEPKTLQQGCSTSLVAALDPSIEESTGGLLQDCAVRPVGKDHAQGRENIEKLWALSEKLVGQTFDL
ncbi:NAD(P)-binding protein [Hyaloscypha variabilis F]|uniref:NAD(P)-binding protein n=1 Tax=Hyaloscypha variabilis (strain UAMH 11265 / GT02V1 / F) TaxID=1149755 RepID=A0A2J6RD85_HYAVF|nr:NAD(P)-binding protein [Hyaloscypha variabilis F]